MYRKLRVIPGLVSSKSFETNQESVTENLSRRTDVIETEINNVSNRHADIRAELEEITKDMESTQDLQEKAREEMKNSIGEDEKFEKHKKRIGRCEETPSRGKEENRWSENGHDRPR